jgi:exodeoxyribonuclease VIII
MTHIMVDLETLSTHYNAAILAIGAVKFDTEQGIYDKFYQAIKSLPVADGFHVSSDTMEWWARQSDEARAVFDDPNGVDIRIALINFSNWLFMDAQQDDVCIWGNGASFDNVILSTAYRICDIEQPWKFYNDRCYRTAKNLYPSVKLQRSGTHHNALDDAESQAEHLLDMKVYLSK